ncbi:hypothetical protein [Mycolicibacterium aubagnense]|uniref:Type II toxin-antitoxin system RelE/ParE family toxin n=1 Tax=Mycolicibacterium aubagnense TaxID=319707 RepID=A0ABN5YPD4_9MYCO|nr:hypothetical protein [Mycolicibacterium aubagnense]TLH64445.1 hypothetical protein C1S80_12230 [Mycolicibacterium aubagnense]BBX82179.1 hypothetical protein MAUB_00520 [Mycolicibacterium aubagnense]
MARHDPVPRPLKKVEFEIRFATREAEKGWTDAKATARNTLVDAWDFLTRTPLEQGDRCYPLSGDLRRLNRGGVSFDRWQYKITDGGRIWYHVQVERVGGVVYLERVETGHPNETDSKKNFR